MQAHIIIILAHVGLHAELYVTKADFTQASTFSSTFLPSCKSIILMTSTRTYKLIVTT